MSVRERNFAEHKNKSLTLVYRFVYNVVCKAVQRVIRAVPLNGNLRGGCPDKGAAECRLSFVAAYPPVPTLSPRRFAARSPPPYRGSSVAFGSLSAAFGGESKAGRCCRMIAVRWIKTRRPQGGAEGAQRPNRPCKGRGTMPAGHGGRVETSDKHIVQIKAAA